MSCKQNIEEYDGVITMGNEIICPKELVGKKIMFKVMIKEEKVY